MVTNKSKSAFKTIAEAAEDLGVATHVLRFWETKFPQIQPMKRTAGRRYYRPDDMEVLRVIKTYLYEKRYTIEGVQKIFKGHKIQDIIGGTIQSDFFEESAPSVSETDNSVQQPQVITQIEEKTVYALSEENKSALVSALNELKEIKCAIDEIKNID